jgi:hypothetical protein
VISAIRRNRTDPNRQSPTREQEATHFAFGRLNETKVHYSVITSSTAKNTAPQFLKCD